MVNQYVSEMVHGGLIDVDGQNNRNLCYRLTPHGKCRKNELFFQCSREIIQLYGAIKQEFRRRLAQHHKEGIRRVVLFGGAETGEIAYNACKMVGIKVLGVVDNDPAKHGARLGDVQITGPWTIEDLRPHAVIITSFGHMDEIYEQVRYLEGKGIKIKRL
jgi:FlaA1/EpsC-like NDP-sugar epimerase